MKYGIDLVKVDEEKRLVRTRKIQKKLKVLMRKGKEMTMKYDKVDRGKETGLNKEIHQAKSSLFL